MEKHSPGPWTTPDGVSIRDQDGAHVAVMCKTPNGSGIDYRGNARLIAVTPDFYAAAELMIASEQSGGAMWWKGFEMLKAAFKKSGGEFPSMDEEPIISDKTL